MWYLDICLSFLIVIDRKKNFEISFLGTCFALLGSPCRCDVGDESVQMLELFSV